MTMAARTEATLADLAREALWTMALCFADSDKIGVEAQRMMRAQEASGRVLLGAGAAS